MKLIKPLLLSMSTVFLVACETPPIDQKSAVEEAAATAVTQEDRWLEQKSQLLEQLRTNAHLRVQEPDGQSIYVQVRSTDSFSSDGSTPSSQLRVVLDDIATALDGQDGIEIEVAGHTDNVGNAQRNVQLSAERAKSVADYLTAKGLTQPITHVGYGSEQPVASNASREGRAVNRRVDLHIQSVAETSRADAN